MSEGEDLGDLIAAIRARNRLARCREVDAAVREALTRYVCSPLPRHKLADWYAKGRLPALRDEIRQAWREQHA